MDAIKQGPIHKTVVAKEDIEPIVKLAELAGLTMAIHRSKVREQGPWVTDREKLKVRANIRSMNVERHGLWVKFCQKYGITVNSNYVIRYRDDVCICEWAERLAT